MHVDVSKPMGNLGAYCFYVWKGVRIVASGYYFNSPVDAANAGNKALAELRTANRIIRNQRFPYRLFKKSA